MCQVGADFPCKQAEGGRGGGEVTRETAARGTKRGRGKEGQVIGTHQTVSGDRKIPAETNEVCLSSVNWSLYYWYPWKRLKVTCMLNTRGTQTYLTDDFLLLD